MLSRLLLVGCATLSVCACAPSTSGLDPNVTAAQVMPQLPPADGNVQGLMPEFRLGALDMISINVFGADELTRRTRIDSAGNINLPLVGTVRAAGMTTQELSNNVADKLRGRYIRNPQVSVSVEEVVSQMVTIDGAVRVPGRYPVAGSTTLQQAIATAQGMSDTAQVTEVVVFRTVNGTRMVALFSMKDIREGRASDPEIFSNDIIVVGTSRSRAIWAQVAQVAPIFSVFTPLAYIR